MIDQLLSKEIQSFIEEHQDNNPNDLRLKYNTISGIPAAFVIDQISGRKKAREKLNTWYNNRRIIYPPSLNLEQSSSERTALQKTKLLKEMMGVGVGQSTIVDLTGGLGVDSFFFSQVCKALHYVEPNHNLLRIAEHNHHELGAANIRYHHSTATEFLNLITNTTTFDAIYLDPSRRSMGQKVFSLSQCEPDVIKLQDNLWQHTNNIIIKTSPLLDIKLGLKELAHVKKVNVISVDNECKEVLFYCEKNFISEPTIDAINLAKEDSSFTFSFSEEENAQVSYCDPLLHLYEPNASLLKSGAFKTIAARFQIHKLHPNTHLYTSDQVIANFPGKVFQIESSVKSDDNQLLNFFDGSKANILTRNYPLSVDALRKKTRLKDGGEKFLIGCSGVKKKFLLVATKLDSL